MATMTNRARFRAALGRTPADRVPMTEICYWPQTLERWRQEGMPTDVGPLEYFGLDPILLTGFDTSLQLPVETLEEGEDWRLERNSDGTVHKVWKNTYAPPCEVEFLIQTPADWEAHRHRLKPDPARLTDGLRDALRQGDRDQVFTALSPGEPGWWVLRTLGMEHALMAMVTDPDWVGEMIATHARMVLECLRQLFTEGLKPDAVWFFSDLCYRNGMLFSPAAYRRLLMPWHQEIAQLCHDHDVFLILHCDGDVGEFLPLLIEAGYDCAQPLEARAGNDVRDLAPLLGDRISFFGNLDQDIFAAGDPAAVEEEVATKVEAAKMKRGYIWHSDHSVPPTVSLETYRLAVEVGKRHGQY